MTDPKRPDDRELEQYLKGDSPLSRGYREASRETAPPELDEVVLAHARAEARRKPNVNRVLAPIALAASVVLAVNLAWNIRQSEPMPPEVASRQARAPADDAPAAAMPSADEAAAAPETEALAKAPAAAPPEAKAAASPRARAEVQAQPEPFPAKPHATPGEPQSFGDDAAAARDDARHKDEARLLASDQAQGRRAAELAQAKQKSDVSDMPARTELSRAALPPAAGAGASAPADAMGMAALADAESDRPPPLTEEQKIDRLITYVAGLQDVVFIRNDKEHSAADAAKHLRLKREKAGDRVQTAADFIRVCASYSSKSGQAYLIRYADGRTRTAEDVLREQLAAMH